MKWSWPVKDKRKIDSSFVYIPNLLPTLVYFWQKSNFFNFYFKIFLNIVNNYKLPFHTDIWILYCIFESSFDFKSIEIKLLLKLLNYYMQCDDYHVTWHFTLYVLVWNDMACEQCWNFPKSSIFTSFQSEL